MPAYIELTLTNGTSRHVEVTGNPQSAVEQLALSGKRSWIETVEGAWINPDHIIGAALIELPHGPTSSSTNQSSGP